MTLSITIIVSISLGIYSLFAFMLAAFAGGSVVNNHRPGRFMIRVLDLFIYLLPGSAIISLILIWSAYLNNSATHYLLWVGIPLVSLLCYLVLLAAIRRH